MTRFDWRRALAPRPWWMNLLFGFCLYMTFVYLPFDLLFKPVAGDEEVWFGFLLHGWAAKLTEPVHWAIYGAGAWGFWKMRRWMWPWGRKPLPSGFISTPVVVSAKACAQASKWSKPNSLSKSSCR